MRLVYYDFRISELNWSASMSYLSCYFLPNYICICKGMTARAYIVGGGTGSVFHPFGVGELRIGYVCEE